MPKPFGGFRRGGGGKCGVWPACSASVRPTSFVSCPTRTAAMAQSAATPQILCRSHISPDGRINAEPPLPGVSPPSRWKETRNILTAPAAGVAEHPRIRHGQRTAVPALRIQHLPGTGR